jgi:chemotaxis protein MotC
MRPALFAIMMAAATPVAQAAGVLEALKPGQTLDALQRVQDSIATGDARALPLQAELISIMDRSFAAALNGGGRETLEAELVLAYALAGGSRAVFSSYIKRTNFEPQQTELVEAISAYLKGDVDKAQEHFEKVEVQNLGARLAPFVALAKGTANIRKQTDIAIQHFELARAMAPATLVEEVALRRTISLHAESGNSSKFLRAAEQYARRFIHSPYAPQFAETFVSGVVRLDDKISDADIATVLQFVASGRRNALYLRITHEAVIAGRLPLAAFAAASALKDGELAKDPARVAQIELYTAIPELTKVEGAALSNRIAAIDATRLPKEDQPLLHAARRTVEAIGQPFKFVDAPVMHAPANEVPADPKVKPAGAVPTLEPVDTIEQSIAANRDKLSSIDALLETAN